MSGELTQEIPDFNAPQYENLILALLKGTCIFIGAGVSKLAGYKLWEELKDSMVDYFWANREKMTFKKRSKLDYSLRENLKSHENIIEALITYT